MFLTTIFRKRTSKKQNKDVETMKKYVYFLQDSPQYPNEIMASSIEEVKSLILESIGADNEGMILNIELAKDYYNKGQNPIYSDPNEYANSKDFFNTVISAGKKIGTELNEDEDGYVQPIQPQQDISFDQINLIQKKDVISNGPKYFEDNGVKYKLENGILYKNNWVPVNELPDKDDYRIVSNSTNKVISSDKYRIEKLDWISLSV